MAVLRTAQLSIGWYGHDGTVPPWGWDVLTFGVPTGYRAIIRDFRATLYNGAAGSGFMPYVYTPSGDLGYLTTIKDTVGGYETIVVSPCQVVMNAGDELWLWGHQETVSWIVSGALLPVDSSAQDHLLSGQQQRRDPDSASTNDSRPRRLGGWSRSLRSPL